MLVHRLRRWTNIKPALGQRSVFLPEYRQGKYLHKDFPDIAAIITMTTFVTINHQRAAGT